MGHHRSDLCVVSIDLPNVLCRCGPEGGVSKTKSVRAPFRARDHINVDVKFVPKLL